MTKAERFERVCSIFEQVRELEPQEQHEQLAELCAGDDDLLNEVRSMLGMHQMESPLDQPSHLSSIDAFLSQESVDRVPTITRYELGERIGEGGMGVVYEAQMRNPRRPVAIKVIRLGMNSTRVVERFDLERQAIARMEHPNIASILDAGMTDDGRPYFAMELLRGPTIVQEIHGSEHDTIARIKLFMQVCNAIQHAHQRGIIHRDIKPSNIIVIQSDAGKIPKVIDFGIAKAIRDEHGIDATMTQQVQAIGTPAYMSPEQADPSIGEIDTRTDVYSLGVVLYELLTGSTPLAKEDLTRKSYQEMLNSIRDQEPPKPSIRLSDTLIGQHGHCAVAPENLRGDLDWIILKCLEKDPDRRYATVSGLVDDLNRYLHNEPVVARPASKAYLMRKFVRRHRTGVIATSLVVLALMLGVAGTTLGLVWAVNEKNRAEQLALAEVAAKEDAKEASERAIREAEAADDLSEFFILDVLSAVDPSKSMDKDLTVRDALINASENIEGKFGDRPDVEARIHNALGFLFNQLGSPQLAEAHHIREWEIAEAENGELSIDAARMMHSVVGSLARQGRDAEAIELTQRQLRVIDGLDTDESKQLRPRAIGNLGALMVRTGRYQEAAPVLKETLEIKREIYGDLHPTTLSTINNLASVLTNLGDLDQSITLASEAYEGRVSVHGSSDPRTFVSLLNLGTALAKAERFSESIPMLREGVENANESLGNEHPTAIDVSNTYARSLYENNEYTEAERVARSSVLIQDQHDPQMVQARTQTAYTLLASSMNKQQKSTEALQYTTALIKALNESDRGTHHLMHQYLRLHGQILTDLKHFEDAEITLLEAWELSSAQQGDPHSRSNLRDALVELYESWIAYEPSQDREAELRNWKAIDQEESH